jgi:hypothetical protein
LQQVLLQERFSAAIHTSKTLRQYTHISAGPCLQANIRITPGLPPEAAYTRMPEEQAGACLQASILAA